MITFYSRGMNKWIKQMDWHTCSIISENYITILGTVVRDFMDFAVKKNAGIQHSVSIVKENVIADNSCAIS